VVRDRLVARRLARRPGFDLATRWPKIVGAAGVEKWKREGSLLFPDGAGVLRRVHYGFFEEGITLPGRPEVPCPTRIFHGVRDETVPVETSRSYASTRPHVELVELDDVHALVDSIETIAAGTLEFFGL
jgi:pimeloyl-ACP methyl ester carboxylesterase